MKSWQPIQSYNEFLVIQLEFDGWMVISPVIAFNWLLTIDSSFGGRVLFFCGWWILCLLWLLLICWRWCCGGTCCIGCRCTCTRMLLIRRHFRLLYLILFPTFTIACLPASLSTVSHSRSLSLSLSPSFYLYLSSGLIHSPS